MAAKKDIFKIDNILIGFGIFLLIVGSVGLLVDPRTYNDLIIMEGSSVSFEDYDGRTLEEVKAEKGPDAEIIVSELPTIRVITAGSGFLLLFVGIIIRRKEKKIISIWDSLERTTEGKLDDMVVSLGLSRDFILKNLKHINAQEDAYFVYKSDTDTIVDGRLLEEHVLTMNCKGCGNTINEKVSLANIKSPACPYCGTTIPVDNLSKMRSEIFAEQNAKMEKSPGSDFSVALFIILLIFFWPAAIIYLIIKKGSSAKKTVEKMKAFQELADENAKRANTSSSA